MVRRRESVPPALDCAAKVEAAELGEGTWIVVLRADRIPHIALLQEGVCHSLEHDGHHRYPARKLWRLIQARRIPTVLCRLALDPARPAGSFFEEHEGLDGDVDCLVPVRDYCASWFPASAACEYPFELLPLLDSAGKLAKTAGMHLPGQRAGARFVLPRYTRGDIRARIAEARRRGGGASA